MSAIGKFTRPKPASRPYLNSFGLDNRMTVVLFAGMGGGCDGLEDAGFHVCMRMLDPLEGAAAHGFDPKSFDHLITVTDAKGRQKVRKPTKTEIGHLVGNSVPKRMVTLLAQGNVEPELMVAAE